MCLYSKLIKNRKYTANKKNGGQVPPILDERVKYVPVGCGNCIECRKQKAREWQVRLLEDIKQNKNGKFITLTFSNESIVKIIGQLENKEAKGYNLDNEIATRAMRLFNERWRKQYGKAIRHWMITELGHEGTENIHLHGIVWTNETYETIAKIWQYGYIWPRPDMYKKTYTNARTINYIVKYVNKIDKDHKHYKSKMLTSGGIGANYIGTYNNIINKYKGTETKDTYTTSTGHTIALPIYWRNKTFTEEQREKLWLQRLDKNERWICGEKIKADDDKAYWGLIDWHRKRNISLGYGTDEKNWDQEQYENARRELLTQKRINDARTNSKTNTRTRNKTQQKQNRKTGNIKTT